MGRLLCLVGLHRWRFVVLYERTVQVCRLTVPVLTFDGLECARCRARRRGT